MKLHQIIMVAVLTTTVFYGSVAAEYQDDKLFGNGRFLRRLRADISKKTSPQPKQSKQPSKNTKTNPRAKEPTPAVRPTGKTPTPAVRTGYSSKSKSKTSLSGKWGKKLSFEAKSSAKPNKSKPSRDANKSMAGFGMQLELKSEKIIVAKVDSRGNAREAGLKKGDVILKAGGVELGSLEEFEEISKVLGEGDQIEFFLESRGKKKDMMIQFGSAPEPAEIQESNQPKKENGYSFAPKRDDNSQTGMHSVLGRRVNKK